MNKVNWGYCSHSWNPIAMRCSHAKLRDGTPSPGCLHCWHLRMADRLAKNPAVHPDRRKAYSGEYNAVPTRSMYAPIKRKKPSTIAVQFMGDLWHDSVPSATIWQVWEVMREASQHTFLTLTKRPDLMAEWFRMCNTVSHNRPALTNVYLGVTVENQDATWRVGELLKIPAAGYWVSVEPMLGPINLMHTRVDRHTVLNVLEGCGTSTAGICGQSSPNMLFNAVSGVALGGESGPGARPMHPDWARSVRDQCAAAGVPLFVKQLHINGKVSKNPVEWPEDLRVRQTAWGMPA